MPTFTDRELAEIMRRNPDLGPVCPPDPPTANAARVAAQSEHALQAAIVAECDRRAVADARWGLVVPIVNGQYRRGQRPEPGLSRAAGLPDLLLPLASRGYISAWLELKVGRNVLSEKQKAWHSTLREHGHFVMVVHDHVWVAIGVLDWYLSDDRLRPARPRP